MRAEDAEMHEGSDGNEIRRRSRQAPSQAGDRAAGRHVVSRTRLLEASVALVEEIRFAGAPGGEAAAGFSPEFRVAFPYRGVLVWHVGCDEVVCDANQVLFVTAGESYRMSEPLPGGYRDLIITPERCLLAELANVREADLAPHPLFRRRCRRADPCVQRQVACLLHWATGARDCDALAAEELVLDLLRAALATELPGDQPARSSARLIGRTKEFLEAEFANPIRLHQVGRAVGASPAYLTDLFRRVEGVSLHRYVVQLRLARALVDLPHAEDLAALALDVGFSSHSHFSAAFRRAFGCTPSEFRQTARAGQRPSLP
jgi:AraC family transcriptional regulator